MKNKNGFTLIELLAVIIILLIILAITVPAVLNLIESARKSAFENHVKLIIKTIDTKRAIDSNYNIDNLNRDNLETDLDIENDNYESISGTVNENNDVEIDAVGQNQWDGLEIHGPKNNLIVTEDDGIDNSNDGSTKACSEPVTEIVVAEYTQTEIPYEYTDAATEVVLNDIDDGYGIINLDFEFPFNQEKFTTLYASSNGYVTFNAAVASEYSIGDMTTGGVGFAIIAPMWSDYKIDKTTIPTTGIFYSLGTENNKKYVVIEYRDISTYSNQVVEATVDFEVKLYEDGLIKMLFKDVSFNDPLYDSGARATVGVHSGGEGYSQYSYKTASLHDGLALSYTSTSYKTPLPIADAVCFTFDSTTGTINDYDETNIACPTSFYIPETIGGVTVQHIGASAFEASGIKNVIFPNTLLTIDGYAFYENYLTCLSVPASVTTIGPWSFRENKIMGVNLQNGLLTIDEDSFEYNNLTELVIPDTVTFIGEYAFSENQINTLKLGNGVKTIDEFAFFLNGMTSVDLGTSVEIIGDGAFQENKLVSVVIPNSVTSIGWDSFEFNETLTNLTLGNSVKEIWGWAFAGSKIKNLTIPSSVSLIEACAFCNNQIDNLTLENGVKEIYEWAFYNNKITDLTIPNSVTFIGHGAFNGNFLPDNQAFTYARNIDGTVNNTTLVGYGGANKDPVIPNTVTTIGRSAFEDALITSVIIPDSVTTIGRRAFYSNMLTSVNIPNTVTMIDSEVFRFNQLTSVVIPDSVTSIGTFAFNQNQLESVTLGNGLITIGGRSFSENVITSLVIPNSVKTINSSAFDKNQIANLSIGTGVTSIGAAAFANNMLPDAQAFIYARNADGSVNNTVLIGYGGANKNPTIPSNVTSIGSNAVADTYLESVTIPGTVTTIGNDAFARCRLTSISLGNGIQSIGGYAFYTNELTSVVIPASVTSIGNYAFTTFGTVKITSVTIEGENPQRFNTNWTTLGFPADQMP